MSPDFPRGRHLELSVAEGEPGGFDERGRLDGAQALLVDALSLPEAELSTSTPASRAQAASSRPPPAGAPPLSLPRAGEVELALAQSGDEACLDDAGERAGGALPLLCPSAPRARAQGQLRAAEAARRAGAVVLRGLDRWYREGETHAGFCAQCERALVEALRLDYGPQLEPFAALAPGSSLAPHLRPFGGARHRLRLTEPLSAMRSTILAARDAARRARQAELMVFGRMGPLSPLALLGARHLDGLIVQLPSLDPYEVLLPMLALRAAMGERVALAELPPNASAEQVRLLAALASACGCDLLLPAGASPAARAALAAHRRYAGLLRERYRPTQPLADVELLLSPLADHQSFGAHLRLSQGVAGALGRGHLQLAVRLLDSTEPVRREQPVLAREGARLLVLAGATALPQAQAPALRRHVESGGDLLLIGRCERVDDEGRVLGPLFPEVKAGLVRLGEGRLYGIPPLEGEPGWALLDEPFQKALRELLARTPRALQLSGRGQLFVRAYLDSERKLDVHVVNLDLREGLGLQPAQGVLLQIAGAAAGGGRSGYWFSPERSTSKDGERITLNPSGFSVSTVLPSVGQTALLSVPR